MRALVSAALLSLLWACRPPAPAPQSSDPVAAAARARLGSGATPADLAAFRRGADRVEAARHQGVGPALPGPPPVPGLEVDPATGLPFGPPLPAAEASGFTWALNLRFEALQAAGLLTPKPLPEPPPTAAWVPWTTGHRGLILEVEQGRVQLLWTGQGLAWQAAVRGFPAVRSWRPLPAPPRLVAWQEGVLWVEGPEGSIQALDRHTGALRRTLPAPAWSPAQVAAVRLPAPEADAPRPATQAEAEEEARIRTLHEAALKGDLTAMLRLGRLLHPKDARVGLAWIRRSAERGLPEAMAELGLRLLPTDRSAALPWLEKAIAAGRTDLRPLLATPASTRP